MSDVKRDLYRVTQRTDDIRVRFLNFVLPVTESGCWLWMGCLGRGGYGQFEIPGPPKKTAWAHRISYVCFRGAIPTGLQLDHLCRVRCCVNPWHLEPVTAAENVRRGENHERNRTQCPQGHQYSAENTYYHAVSNSRHCKICKVRAFKAFHERRRAGLA